jgi:hypothetical protein
MSNREVMEDSIQRQMNLYETDVVVPIWDLIDLYYTYMHPIHPIIPKDIFLEHVWNESPILLLGMYASACRYRHALRKSQFQDPEAHAKLVAEDFEEGTRYYKQARNKIDRFLDTPCLQTILALRLLGNFAISVGEGWLFFFRYIPWTHAYFGSRLYGACLLWHGNHYGERPKSE